MYDLDCGVLNNGTLVQNKNNQTAFKRSCCGHWACMSLNILIIKHFGYYYTEDKADLILVFKTFYYTLQDFSVNRVV